jgi:hypothetical protein
MPISSGEAANVEAAAATDSCTNWPAVIAAVVFVRLALVGSAMALPPAHTISLSALALEKRRGNTMRRSAGDGKYELPLVRAAGASIATDCGYPRVPRERDVRSGAGMGSVTMKLNHRRSSSVCISLRVWCTDLQAVARGMVPLRVSDAVILRVLNGRIGGGLDPDQPSSHLGQHHFHATSLYHDAQPREPQGLQETRPRKNTYARLVPLAHVDACSRTNRSLGILEWRRQHRRYYRLCHCSTERKRPR